MFDITTVGYATNSIYASYFNKFPSSYTFNIYQKNKNISSRLSDLDKIKSLLKADHVVQLHGFCEPEEDSIQRYPELKGQDEYTNCIAFIYNDKELMIYLDLGSFSQYLYFYYNKELFGDIEYFKTLGNQIKECLYYLDNNPKEADLSLVYYNNKEGFKTLKSKVTITDINLNENYNDDLLPVHNKLLEFLKSRNTGVCLLRGEPGTGKSYYLRYLLTSCPNKYIFIPNSITSHLSSPDFLSFMMENKDSVFILEDCEQVLFSRELNPGNLGISGILNIADGLMSDVLNIKFICTFNTDINNIDKALLREGRCIINYEFTPLSIEKTEYLLNKLGKKVENCCEMTLAQIYNYNDQINSEITKKKIGF